LTIRHCVLSAELTKNASFRLFFWRFICPLGVVTIAFKIPLDDVAFVFDS